MDSYIPYLHRYNHYNKLIFIMPEPISLIGFSLGAISFLLGQVSALESKGRAFFECHARMRSYASQLKGCLIDFEDWKHVWGPQYYTKSEYTNIWSEDGYQHVTASYNEVVELAEEIANQFDALCVDDGNENDIQQINRWKKLLSRWRKQGRRIELDLARLPIDDAAIRQVVIGRQNNTVFGRFAFFLYRDQKFSERISRLESLLQDLKKISFDEYKSRHGNISSAPHEPEAVQETVNSSEFLQNLSIFTDQVYRLRARDNAWDSWALEIEPPIDDDETVVIPWDVGPIAIGFTMLKKDDGHDSSFKRISVHFNSEISMNINHIAETVVGRVSSAESESLPNYLEQLQPANGRSFSLKCLMKEGWLKDDMVYKSWAEDRLRLIYGFAHWMILLWGVQWTLPPCSCGIRFETVATSLRRYTYTTGEHYQCLAESLSQQRLLLIGLVLAELTLATPLRVIPRQNPSNTCQDSGMYFPSHDYEEWESCNGGGRWKPLGRDSLLKNVQDKSSYRFKEAVKFCLDNRTMAFQDGLKYNHVIRLHDRIVKPLREDYLLISRQRSQFRTRQWWVNFILGHPWPSRQFLENDIYTSIGSKPMHVPGSYESSEAHS
ncbi:hypothetical protein BDV34DRAFT_207444, partial [Aspergillus parasiticus]